MKPFQPLYIHNEKTNATSVQISLEEWEGILNELEELEDIRSFDQALKEEFETIPFDQAVREIEDGYDT